MCFTWDWFLHLLIVLVILCVVIGILRIWVFPFIAANGDARIVATINLLIWGACAIFAIYVVAYLLICAFSGGGLGFPGRVR